MRICKIYFEIYLFMSSTVTTIKLANKTHLLFCIKVNFFQKEFFCFGGFHFYKVNIHYFCILLKFFSKYFLWKLKPFRQDSYYNKNLLRNYPKNWQKVGIHFYENILCEINLPLPFLPVLARRLIKINRSLKSHL